MGFVKIAEQGFRRSSSMDEKGVRKYTQIFQVFTDNPQMDSQLVRDAPGIPNLFDSYASNTGFDTDALCIAKEARENSENHYQWEVECHFSSAAGDVDQAEENPLDRPSLRKWTRENFKRPAEVDLDSFYVVNSAWDPFDPPPELDAHIRVLTITRNETDFDPQGLEQYSYAINKEDFFGYTPGQARMDPIDAEEAWENGTEFWKVTYTIRFRTDRADPWNLHPLDQGTRYSDGTHQITPYDKAGQPPSRPFLLDGNGNKLAVNTSAVYLNFRVYPTVSFIPLKLEQYSPPW